MSASPTRGPRLLRALAAGLFAALAPAAPAMAQNQSKVLNTPAEKFAIAPGGVDLRTGRYVFSETDLSAGGLSLTRTMRNGVLGDSNPFGNFSHNWDIFLVERRVNIDQGKIPGEDYRMSVHFGGRSLTFEGMKSSGTYGAKSDGPVSFLKIIGGSRADGREKHRYEGADGTVLIFQAMGTGMCGGRCPFVEEMIEPDGTRYTFEYTATGVAGVPIRLSKVTSSRGYALLMEGVSGSLVSKACILNLAVTSAPPAGGACPDNALATARYGYEGGRLVTAIPASGDSSASRFAYTVGTDNRVSKMEFRKPGQSQPWLTNALGFSADEEGAGQEIVLRQAFADGQTYDYSYVRTPVPAAYSDHYTIAGGAFKDAEGRETIVRPDFPYMPGSRSNLCYGPPSQCPVPTDVTNETTFTYQQTPGPVEITDPLGRTTTMDYCDEASAAGLPAGEIDRCSVTRMQSSVDPEGIKTRYAYDGRNNIIKTIRYPKPGATNPDGSTPAPLIVEAEYDIHNVKAQDKPLWIKDANGNLTRWTYAPEHGGVLTETGPAVDGVTPQKRNTYVQRQARLWDGSAAGP
ncbi:MAG TPA: hypothetical protein VF619_13550, partial [Allosphingosinicella sp.]